MANTIETMEVTSEEFNMIVKHRTEKLRKEMLDDCKERLIDVLKEIDMLGGSVKLPYIGGKYVTGHHPKVKADNVSVVTTRYPW